MRACTYAKFPTIIFPVVAMQSVAMLPSVSLKDRVFCSGSSCSSTSLPVGTASRQGRTYRSWTQQQMERAVTAVLNEGSSIWRAALECGVPKSSLGDCISGRVSVDATCGPSLRGKRQSYTCWQRESSGQESASVCILYA